MKLPLVLAVLIGILGLACSTVAPAPAEPTPNIDATVEARVAQERATMESTVSQERATVVPTLRALIEIEPKVRPTPTLTLNEIFHRNSIGELSDEEAAQILVKRKQGNSGTTSTTSSTVEPEITPTAEPTPLREPTPVPILNSAVGYRSYMLELINQDRKEHGLAVVSFGNNVAAQIHAEELFENGFTGHWGLDGLKPYMRYTLAGGTGVESENVSGGIAPKIPGVRYAKTPVKESLRETSEGDSRGTYAIPGSPGKYSQSSAREGQFRNCL